tara:strand:+ start:6474 stop:7871 length:1398 start_codon:yes stop_codon:yes gene_type:complete
MTANQNDFVIDNGTGFAVRQDIQDALQALAGNSSGDSEPSVKYSYQWWADTGSTPPVMKLRNSSNDGWITIFELDGTITLEDGSASSPGLSFRSDPNTGLARLGADKMSLITGGNNRIVIDSNGLIGMGVDDPTSFSADADNLVVAGSAATGITIKSSTTTTGNLFFADGTSGNERFRGYILYEHNNDKLVFGSQGTAIISAQYNPSDTDQVRVGIGHTAPNQPLHVKTEGETMVKMESTDNPNSYLQLVNTNSDGSFIGSEFITGNATGQKDNLSFYVDNTSAQATRFMSLNSQNLELFNNTNLKLSSGGGIDFSNVSGSAAGSTSALLNDYELGTWTPVVNQGIDGGAAYQIQSGWYCKIGSCVSISFQIKFVDSATGSTGDGNAFRISGIPFSSANLSPVYSSGGSIQFTNINFNGGVNVLMLFLGNNSTIVEFFQGRFTEASVSGANASKTLFGNMTYRVA